ncbi:MAG: DivIVA domain-containing protein [Oscillospiraceae bacterium]
MNANEITTKRFGKATFNGYNTDDVDAFLREVSSEFSQLQKEKNELERKLEVLADKIREYRDDEDALKDALLLAQKQGNAIVAESKAAAEELKASTEEACEKQIAEAQEKHDTLIAEGEEYKKNVIAETNDRADAMIKDARAKAEEIKRLMNEQREKEEVVLQQTRKEVFDYRARVLALYKAHMEFIEALPEKVENDFVRKTAEAVEKREEERKAEEKPAFIPAPAKEPEPVIEPVQEPVSEPDEAPAFGEAYSDDDEQTASAASQELPFFNSGSEPITRHTDLLFGQKNKQN